MSTVDLRLGDNVEVMRDLPDSSIDLILTSPPYDDLRTYASGYTFDFEGVSAQCLRVLKLGGVLVWVVGDQTKDGSESGTSFRQALHFKSIGLKLRDTMIWRKKDPFPGGDHKTHYRGAFEFMFIFSKGRPNTVNVLREPCIGPVRTRNVPSKQHGRPNGRYEKNTRIVTSPTKIRENIWTFLTDRSGYGHPAVFPIQLATDHILSWTNPGDVVLDPFAGSGTTGVACLNTGRNFIGIELSPPYFAIAQNRLAEAAQQPRLFA